MQVTCKMVLSWVFLEILEQVCNFLLEVLFFDTTDSQNFISLVKGT